MNGVVLKRIVRQTLIFFILCFETLQVYKGYLDDLRNTDNSWMETVLVNFHDETRETIGNFEFEVCYFNVMNMKFP